MYYDMGMEPKVTMVLGAVALTGAIVLTVNMFKTAHKRPQISAAKTEIPVKVPYEVVSGDSLWRIAQKECQDGYKWLKIALDNGIQQPDLIYAGDKLKIECE